MSEKLKIDLPIAVEGKYDKIKLASIIDANIITTGGFGIFSSDEKKLLIRRIAEPRGIIVLTDSDGAGLVIRNYFRSILPPDKLIHLYIPQISGREKRKRQPSKAGILGVEGIDAGMLRRLLEPFAVGGDRDVDEASANTDILNADFSRREVTKTDFYSDRAVRRRVERVQTRRALPSARSARQYVVERAARGGEYALRLRRLSRACRPD